MTPSALVLLALGCQRPHDSHGDSSPGDDTSPAGDTAPTGDTGTTATPCPLPASAWAGQGPIDGLATPVVPDSPSTWRVWWATSPDGATWTYGGQAGVDFASLDVFVCGDEIVVSGMMQQTLPDAADLVWLSTSDLSTWTSGYVKVADADAVVDPSLRIVDGQVVATLFDRGREEGDPIWLDGPHDIYETSLGGSPTEGASPVFSSTYLADPMITELGGGAELLVATQGDPSKTEENGRITILVESRPSPSDPWTRLTSVAAGVPYVAPWTLGGHPGLLLLSQIYSDFGTWPIAWFSGDQGKTWGEIPMPIAPGLGGYDTCTSPGLVRWHDEWVFVCASQGKMGGPP